MGCPTEDTLLAVAEGRFAGEAVDTYQHIESCDTCRSVMNDFARSYGRDGDEPHAGLRMGRYLLRDKLGQGGMGVVWRADDVELSRAVAIKFIAPLMAGDEPARARFKREAQAAAALDHPHIGAVLEVGELHGQPYLIMPYYEGETLKQRIERGPIPENEAVQLLTDLAGAVGAAHSAGIVHRDVKPANVILTAAGLKVLDFGLAKWLAQDDSLTGTGEMIGTIAYMAPEQVRREKLDARADVWSLGIVGMELLCGERPFFGNSSTELANAVLAAEPRIPVRLPRDLTAILLTCLQKDSPRRYANAGVLANELRHFAAGEPVTARRWLWAEKLRRRIQAQRSAFVLGALALAALALAGEQVWTRSRAAARIRRTHESVPRVEEQVAAFHQARLLPIHDITAERRRLSDAIASLEHDLPRLAPEGTAEASRWIGDGRLALDECEQARPFLEAAWHGGERAPEVAYSLGLDLGCLLREGLEEARRIPDAKERAKSEAELDRALRQPAGEYLRLAKNSSGVSASYVEALIAYNDRKYPESLVAAQRAFDEQPSLFEAGLLVSADYGFMARKEWHANRRDQALHLLEQADHAWMRVLDIARSDERVHLVYADERLVVSHLSPALATDKEFDHVLDICERALKINPKSKALAIESWVWWQRAEALVPREDPRPFLQKAETLGLRAVAVTESWQAYWGVGSAAGDRGAWEIDHGFEPRPALTRSTDALKHALTLQYSGNSEDGLALSELLLAQYHAGHGIDPRAELEASDRLSVHSAEVDHSEPGPELDQTNTRREQAQDDLTHGRDPRAEVARALEHARRAGERDVDNASAHDYAAAAKATEAEWLLATGADAHEPLAGAEEHLRASIKVRPDRWEGHAGLASVSLLRARVQLAAHVDPRPSLSAARQELARAHAIDPRRADAIVLANVELWAARAERVFGRDPRSAIERGQTAAKMARQLWPDDAPPLVVSAQLLLERAPRAIDRAPQAIDSPSLEAAIEDCRHAQRIDPRLAAAFQTESRLLEWKSRAAAADARGELQARASAARQKSLALDATQAAEKPAL